MPLGKRVAKWLEQLQGPTSDTRLKAAECLLQVSEHYFYQSKITPEDRNEVIHSIFQLSADQEIRVRASVAQLIGLVREWSEETETALRRLLSDHEACVLVSSVYAAGSFGPLASPLVEQILGLATFPDREVRWRVAWAISEIRRCNPEAVTSLIGLAGDDDRTARMYALDAMANCDVDAATVFSSVVRGFDDSAGEVQCAACRVVASLPYDWSPVEAKLVDLFRTGSIDAVRAICRNWPTKVLDPEINSWLQDHRGFWWVNKILAGDVAANENTGLPDKG